MEETKTEKIPFAKPYFGSFSERLALKEKLGMMVDEAAIGVRVSNGDKVKKLEEEVARISGADYAIACSSCTQGLVAMLKGCNAYDKTAYTQSFTWDSTMEAINSVQGARAMPFDIDYESWSVRDYPHGQSPSIALAVDTFGMEVCPTSGVPLFYDRAHSLGVRFKELGIASVLSLSPSKIVTTTEGGVILTNKKSFAQSMMVKRDLSCRLSEVLAVIGLHTLKFLPDILEWKRMTFDEYRKAFPQFQFQQGEGNHQVIGMLLESHEQQQRLLSELNDEIEFKAYYVPMHIKYGWRYPLPVTEDIYRRIICIPSWYGAPTQHIINRIKETLNI